MPASHIVISATHSHTAPDYVKELWLNLGGERQEPLRTEYIQKLINGTVSTIAKAHAEARPTSLDSGAATQKMPLSFNRRFVMRDGSVRNWMNLGNPDVVRASGPILRNSNLTQASELHEHKSRDTVNRASRCA